MLSNYIFPGQKIELETISRIDGDNTTRKTYQSRIFEILSDDRIEVMMPMEKTKLILLPIDGEYNTCFFTEKGLYQCDCKIIDRYKSNNVYLLVLELTSNLRKYQRREFYRFSCALDMSTRKLEEEEISALEKNSEYLVPGLPLKRSVIVDISGGGIRFIANQRYDEGSLIYCKYSLQVENKIKQYDVVGKVLRVSELDNRPGVYEHRVQYLNLDYVEREEIIKYIFDEERKDRQRNQQ